MLNVTFALKMAVTSKGSVLEIYSPFSSPAPFNNPRSWPDTPSSPMMTKEEENTVNDWHIS